MLLKLLFSFQPSNFGCGAAPTKYRRAPILKEIQ